MKPNIGVKKVGNMGRTPIIFIPASFQQYFGWSAGQKVKVSAADDGICIAKVQGLPENATIKAFKNRRVGICLTAQFARAFGWSVGTKFEFVSIDDKTILLAKVTEIEEEKTA